jgi:hypothetical protein
VVVGSGGVTIPTPTYNSDPKTLAPSAAVTNESGGTTSEPAPYSAVRLPQHPYGFVSVDVDPGSTPGGTTAMHVTFYPTALAGSPSAADTFTLRRPRRDARVAAGVVPLASTPSAPSAAAATLPDTASPPIAVLGASVAAAGALGGVALARRRQAALPTASAGCGDGVGDGDADVEVWADDV